MFTNIATFWSVSGVNLNTSWGIVVIVKGLYPPHITGRINKWNFNKSKNGKYVTSTIPQNYFFWSVLCLWLLKLYFTQGLRDIALRGWGLSSPAVYQGFTISASWTMLFFVLSWFLVRNKLQFETLSVCVVICYFSKRAQSLKRIML